MHKLSRYGSIKPENELIYAIGSEYYGGSKRTEVFVTLKDNGVFDGKYCDLISSGENASFQGALLKRNGVYSSVTVTSKERRYVLNGYYTIRIY